ncbi:hypothetical protein [Peribacillus cavernae]|nr:hypothetical protein [Peribacillus cavernae]MDQ0218462.1 hypothetical protein [Peribacillus cavernae]
MKKRLSGFIVAFFLISGFALIGTTELPTLFGNVGTTELPTLF